MSKLLGSKLLSLVIVYFIHRHLKNYGVFQKLQQHSTAAWLDDLLFKTQMLANNYTKIPMAGSTAILIIAVVLISLLMQNIFYYAFHNLGTNLLNIIVLLYCIYSAAKKNYSSMFVASFEHIFNLLFWFAVLGPIGLILSWLFMLGGVKEEQASGLDYAKNISNFLFNMHTIAAWLPARITGLIFSLVGDFEKGFATWKATSRTMNMSHTELLDTCGVASLGNNPTEEQSPLLIERTFVAWIIFCILITIII